MDQATQIEISKIIDYVEDQATRHFAEDRSKSEPYETNISLGDEHPARAALICKGLTLGLCELYKASRVHAEIKESHIEIRISRF